MRYKSTAILVAVGLAAALYYLFVERPRQAALDDTARRENTLTDVAPADVEALFIERPDLSLAARRRGAAWRIEAPVADTGDDAAFSMLLRAVCGAAVERRIDAGEESLAAYGLDPPAAIVRFAGKDGRPLLEIRIGDHNVTKSHCYAALGPDRTVLLVPAGVRRYAVQPFVEYRDRRVVEAKLEEIVAVAISSPSRSMNWRLDRAARVWFAVQDGDTVPGDSTAIEAVIRELRGLRALDIPEKAAIGGDEFLVPEAGSIVFQRAGSEPLALRFGAARDSVCYVERSDDARISLVDAAVLRIFARTIDQLRNRRLLRFSANDLARITLETRERTVSVHRAGTRWTYANPGFGEIAEESALRLLETLRSLEADTIIAERVPAAGAYGFSQPFVRLVLADAAGDVIDELRVGAPAPGEELRYATSRSAPRLAALGRAAIGALETSVGGPGTPR
jgi:hypothetical protein